MLRALLRLMIWLRIILGCGVLMQAYALVAVLLSF